MPRFLKRIDLKGHAFQIERVLLGHIDHVDPDLSSLDSIFNTKINSLEITRSVRIRPQKHIIAVELITHDDSVEITALKISTKLQKAVLLFKRRGLINLIALRFMPAFATLLVCCSGLRCSNICSSSRL